MHAIEKILARAAGKDRVRAGEIVTAAVDLAEINDLYLQVIQSFEAMDGRAVWDPDKVAFVFDHYSPPPTPKARTITASCGSLPPPGLPTCLTSTLGCAIR